jgi:BMFP domain-containing protein YqiC
MEFAALAKMAISSQTRASLSVLARRYESLAARQREVGEGSTPS